MKLSAREMLLLLVTALAVLIGLSYWVGKPKVKSWKGLIRNQHILKDRIEIANRLLAQQVDWDKRLNKLKIKLKKYPEKKDITADYLKILERVAGDNNLSLLKRKPQKEKHHGGIYELAIDCTWNGNLEALIHFLYALEQENVTMDIQELSVTFVSGGKGKLKGNFTVMCIYTRGSEQSSPVSKESTNSLRHVEL